jgi:hypothetical protein
MPMAARPAAPSVRFRTSSDSVIDSMSPMPNTGVGMRKITLFCDTACAKLSCTMLQPLAFPVPSLRWLITYSACTPPSAWPFGSRLKRASRMGPFSVMNEGTVLRAPNAVAMANWGFTAGAVPPIAGWLWQPPQPSRLKRGPRPSPTPSASSKSSRPTLKKVASLAVSPASGPPARAAPP